MSLALQTRKSPDALTDAQVYQLLFAATFVIFLGAAIVRRAFRAMTGGTPQFGGRTSLFSEAKATGYSSLAFAFTG